jgi:hypothetical protein
MARPPKPYQLPSQTRQLSKLHAQLRDSGLLWGRNRLGHMKDAPLAAALLWAGLGLHETSTWQ